MFRRGVTLFLLPVMLLSQWVGMYRCMGGCGAVGKDIGPHVHLNAVIPGKSAASACSCQRQRQAQARRVGQSARPPLATANANGTAAAEQIPPSRHGDDVLHLSFDASHCVRASSDGGHANVGSERCDQFVVLDVLSRWPNQLGNPFASRLNIPPIPRCSVYIHICSLLL